MNVPETIFSSAVENKETPKFSHLREGDVFEYNEGIYVKISKSSNFGELNSICLGNWGESKTIKMDDEITFISKVHYVITK